MNRQSLFFTVGGVVAAGMSLFVARDLSGCFGAALALLMAAIAHRDWRDFVIPDLYSGAAFALALLATALLADDGFLPALGYAVLRALLLGAAFLAIRVGYYRLRGRHGLGLGDVKLACVAGAWLDWASWPIAIEIAALSALAAALAYRTFMQRPLRSDTRLPFGLFLAPSIWIAWLIEMLERSQRFG